MKELKILTVISPALRSGDIVLAVRAIQLALGAG
jgi:hypothetical protein